MYYGKQSQQEDDRVLGDSPSLPAALIEQLAAAAKRNMMPYRPDPERLSYVVRFMSQV